MHFLSCHIRAAFYLSTIIWQTLGLTFSSHTVCEVRWGHWEWEHAGPWFCSDVEQKKTLTSSVRVAAKNKKQLEDWLVGEVGGWGEKQYQWGPGQHPAADKKPPAPPWGRKCGWPPSSTNTSTLQRSKATGLGETPLGTFLLVDWKEEKMTRVSRRHLSCQEGRAYSKKIAV